MKKIKTTTVMKYAVYFALLVLLSYAKTFYGLRPFGLGLLIALVYCKKNLAALAPMYVVAQFIASPDWQGLALGFAPIVVLLLTYYIFFKLRRPITMPAINICALLCQVPYVFFNLDKPFIAAANVVVTEAFTYAAIVVLYAVFIRGLRYKFTVDELVSGGVVLLALGAGFYCLDIYGFNLYFVYLAFLTLFSVSMFGSGAAFTIGLATGLGAAFAGGNIALAAAAVCWTAAALMFKRQSLFLSAAAALIFEAVLGLYFDVYVGYNYLKLIAAFIGFAAFLAIPKKIRYMASSTLGVSDGRAGKTIVNRNRLDVSGRLLKLSDIFRDMQELLTDNTFAASSSDGAEELSRDVAENFCAGCAKSETCFSALGGDTSAALEPIAEAALIKGRITLLDMPPFITGRCNKMNGLVAEINERADKLNQKNKTNESIDVGRAMMAEQMGGTAQLLRDLSQDIKKAVSFNVDREKYIIDELSYHNIVCSEAIVYGDEDISVTVVVRDEDADKKILPKIVSKCVKCKVERDGQIDRFGSSAGVHLAVCPKYDLVVGEAAKSRDGNAVCGDVRGAQKIGLNHALVALCDGMGSGVFAEKSSAITISMIENFYKAGFSNQMILGLVNKLLSLKGEENFSSLDMCVFDLKTGAIDLIKMGATEGFIKRKDGVEIVESHALPIGILEDAAPSIERKNMQHGDVLVLLSDGVTDVMTADDLKDFLIRQTTLNPQTLADAILAEAEARGAEDDITAVCVRLFSR